MIERINSLQKEQQAYKEFCKLKQKIKNLERKVNSGKKD